MDSPCFCPLCQMMNLCNSWVLYLGPHSRLFDEILVYSLFLAAFLSIGGSYTAVMQVARSASTDQVSAINRLNQVMKVQTFV